MKLLKWIWNQERDSLQNKGACVSVIWVLKRMDVGRLEKDVFD